MAGHQGAGSDSTLGQWRQRTKLASFQALVPPMPTAPSETGAFFFSMGAAGPMRPCTLTSLLVSTCAAMQVARLQTWLLQSRAGYILASQHLGSTFLLVSTCAAMQVARLQIWLLHCRAEEGQQDSPRCQARCWGMQVAVSRQIQAVRSSASSTRHTDDMRKCMAHAELEQLEGMRPCVSEHTACVLYMCGCIAIY